MSALAYFNTTVIPAAMSLLPARLDTPEARAMLLATGLQESCFTHRRQVGGGPALGFHQFEPGAKSAGAGILTLPSSRPMVLAALQAMHYPATWATLHAAMEHSDVLDCVMARALLWTHPKRLPGRGEAEYAWEYYAVDLWRPGKPHPKTWAAFYQQAWGLVG